MATDLKNISHFVTYKKTRLIEVAKPEEEQEVVETVIEQKSMFGEVTSVGQLEEFTLEPPVPPMESPEKKYKVYQQAKQKPVTQKKAARAVKEYLELATKWALHPQTQECVTKYGKWLQSSERCLAQNTIKTKLIHVKTYVQVAYNEKVITPAIKGEAEQVRPHEAYKEPDVLELIKALKNQPLDELKRKHSGQKPPSKGKQFEALFDLLQ